MMKKSWKGLVYVGVAFFFQAEDGIRDLTVTGVQTCALPIYRAAQALVAARCRGAALAEARPAAGPGARRRRARKACRGAEEFARARHRNRDARSEEHTSELQSQSNLVCRLLLEKKNRYDGPQQTRHPFLARMILSVLSTPLFAQRTDLSPAGQCYGPPTKVGKRFCFMPRTKAGR